MPRAPLVFSERTAVLTRGSRPDSGEGAAFRFSPPPASAVDQAKAFEIIVGLLLTVVTAITGASLKAILGLMSRLDRLEARLEVVLQGPDKESGVLGDIRYLRNRTGWIGRAAHALRDRFYHVERHIHLEGMPPLELPPE